MTGTSEISNDVTEQLHEEKFWPADLVCSICEALEPDDEIVPGAFRERPLRVLGFEEQTNNGFVPTTDYPYHILWLEGNGTRYRLRWSHTHTNSPRLHTNNELTTWGKWQSKCDEKRVVGTTGGEIIRRISVVGVDDSDLLDWALARQVNITNGDGNQTQL